MFKIFYFGRDIRLCGDFFVDVIWRHQFYVLGLSIGNTNIGVYKTQKNLEDFGATLWPLIKNFAISTSLNNFVVKLPQLHLET